MLFFKKKEKKTGDGGGRDPRFWEFASQFLPDELTVLAVTGANGFSGSKLDGDGLWRLSTGLTAWMEEDSPDIHREEAELAALGDDRLLEFLRQRVRPDFIIKFKARPSWDGKRLLLLDLPEPGFDPDLKAILEEQKKPATFWVDGLGTFSLDRRVKWFETQVDWLGTQASLSFDQAEEEEMKRAQETAKALLASAAEWDRRVRDCAAKELLELANDWAEDSEEGEPAPVTREGFIGRMTLEAIQVDGEGGFEFWFDDGDLFYGHSIHVAGNLEKGPDWAQMEG